MRTASLMLLVACASPGVFEPATHYSYIRRMAEERLSSCRRYATDLEELQLCYRQTRSWCAANGLERTCAEGQP